MGMNVNQPAFAPDQAATVNLVATNASARVQVRTNTNARSHHFRIFNSSTVTVFIETGDVSIVASASTGYPVAAGTVEVITAHGDYAAAITSAAGSNTIYFTPGEGI